MVFHGATSELVGKRRKANGDGWSRLGQSKGGENGRISMHWSKKWANMKDLDGLGWTWHFWLICLCLKLFRWSVLETHCLWIVSAVHSGHTLHAFRSVHHVSAKTIAVSSLRAAFHHVKCSLEAKWEHTSRLSPFWERRSSKKYVRRRSAMTRSQVACGLYIPLRWTLQPLQLCDFLKLSGHHKPISCGKHSTIIQIQLEVSMVPSSRAMYWSGVVTSRVQHVLAKDLSTEWIRRQIFSSWWRICNVSSTGLRWLRGDTCACWSLIWFLIQGYTL